MLLMVTVCSPISAETPDSTEICDVQADYALGIENYAEAIRFHLEVIHKHRGDALAHYHLGFAYGMVGRRDREREEYREALSLGRVEWGLLLNLGLAYFDQQDYQDAIGVLRIAALLGPEHAETHYNLALAYERLAMLASAEQELLVSLTLEPEQPEARNMLALVYEESGDRSRARDEWSELVRTNPDYQPARANLAILDAVNRKSAASSATEPPQSAAKSDPANRREKDFILAGERKGSDTFSAGPCGTKQIRRGR